MTRIKEKRKKVISILAACILAFGIGYFMVEFISTSENPPLGMTFHVIVGFLLMCISVIVVGVELKKMFFPKKKKKGRPPVFLDHEKKTKQSEL